MSCASASMSTACLSMYSTLLACGESGDEVETEGYPPRAGGDRSSDRVLFVIDARHRPGCARLQREEDRALPQNLPLDADLQKCDQAVGLPVADTISGPPRVLISRSRSGPRRVAHTPEAHHGLSHRRSGHRFTARQRHLDALARAAAHVDEGARSSGNAAPASSSSRKLRGPAGARRDHV